MPTVNDILKESGFTDEQITALEPKAVTAFTRVLSQAEQAREAAELAQRSNVDFYENKIAPSLANWDEERQRIENARAQAAAEAAFYRTQAEAARTSGFIPADAPGFTPRDERGRYVAGVPGATPGSPTFDITKIYERAGDAINLLSDIAWEHEKLYGSKMPISPSELIRQADSVKLDPRTYAAKRFDWDKRREEIQKKEQEEHDAKIRAEAKAESDRQWSEKIGSNPDVRMPVPSRYADLPRAVQSGTRPDPLMLAEGERRAATRLAIRTELSGAER